MSEVVRGNLRKVIFALLTVAAVGFAARALWGQYLEFRASATTITVNWVAVAGASAIVLVAYGILIETWRRIVRQWESELAFRTAARIWIVSNLGKYIPGKVWQIASMGAMAKEAGVSPVAAVGSSILINLVNVVVGFGVTIVTGSTTSGVNMISLGVVLGTVALILALPRLLPVLAQIASRAVGRAIELPQLPRSAIWTAALGCSVAWLLYGVAFQLFTMALLGAAPGGTLAYIAAFTGSYLAGYIALFAPGGVGVRELTLIEALRRVALPAGGAGVVVFGSRLWLTVLEVIPSVLLLAVQAAKRNRSTRT